MKRYLKFITTVNCLLLLFSVSLLAADKYVSSRYSAYYHKPNCKKVLRIDPLIKVIYNSSKEALEAGKRPCQVCKPPAEVYWEEKKPQENWLFSSAYARDHCPGDGGMHDAGGNDRGDECAMLRRISHGGRMTHRSLGVSVYVFWWPRGCPWSSIYSPKVASPAISYEISL